MSPRKKSCLLVPKGQKLRKLFKGGRVVTTWGSPPRLPPAGPCVRPAYACLPGGQGGCMWRSGGLAIVISPPPRWPPAVAWRMPCKLVASDI